MESCVCLKSTPPDDPVADITEVWERMLEYDE
jgi:hypothetical protein